MTKILVADALSPEGVKVLEADGEFQVDNRPTITPEELLDYLNNYTPAPPLPSPEETAERLRDALEATFEPSPLVRRINDNPKKRHGKRRGRNHRRYSY